MNKILFSATLCVSKFLKNMEEQLLVNSLREPNYHLVQVLKKLWRLQFFQKNFLFLMICWKYALAEILTRGVTFLWNLSATYHKQDFHLFLIKRKHRKNDLLSHKSRKIGNYCSWRGIVGVIDPVSSFNMYIFNFLFFL